MGVKLSGHLHPCEGCLAAKGIRKSIPKATQTPSDMRLGPVFADLTGLKKPMIRGGKWYAIVLSDNCTRYTWVSFLTKSDASCALEIFLSDTLTDGSVEMLRMDSGTEWKGAFDEICHKERICREVVPPHSSQFNECAERGIAMLEAMTFAARFQAKNLAWSA